MPTPEPTPGPTPEEMAAERRRKQIMAIEDAVTKARTAVAAVNTASSDAEVMAADDAITALMQAIGAGADVSQDTKDAYTTAHDELKIRLMQAKEARKTAMDEAEKAMMETARKLNEGISAPTGSTSSATRRHAAYGDGANANDIAVSIGTAEAVNLSEDKKTMVADLHGWKGKRYEASPDGGGTYEAHVYSNIETPEGKKFGHADSPNDEFQYQLVNGELSESDTEAETNAKLVASPSFDHTAGVKQFKLPSPNPSGATKVTFSGSFNGVSGTYTCTPGSNNTCAVSIAAEGFRLGGVDNANAFTAAASTWMFKPTDPNAKVMGTPSTIYASYGWWLHKSADDKTWTASAFVASKGDVPAASGITALQGSATYVGGAVGKYALHSSSGGTNDAGHFTAKATLEADFKDDMIMGTINEFMGADGKSRNWSVELKKSGIGNTGVITGSDGTGDPMKTVWTIGDTAAPESGQWSGNLWDNGDDSVPKVATGTFFSTYSNDGKIVGAFGANKE